MSKAVVEAMKRRMTLEERREFVRECEDENGKDWFLEINSKKISILFGNPFYSFFWKGSRKGGYYWRKVYDRFTPKELNLVINLKEFENNGR